MDLLEELKSLIATFDEKEIEYALCGGLAMAIYAMPRATLDIDLMIERGSLPKVVKAIARLGFTLKARPMRFRGGKIQIHRISKTDASSGEILNLDLLITTPGIQPAWKSRSKVKWEGGAISVVSPRGLIALKSLRRSGQDKDDIRYLRSIRDKD
ncbi:MAG: nucleotidyl transferase AbiEii/AbiGii toxin family protein [Acidobacteriia bacterium]|nr:nucleotidyl transferase AbiEii/AbiGii toxin family protein [Terriglobia bacterium]